MQEGPPLVPYEVPMEIEENGTTLVQQDGFVTEDNAVVD